MDVVGIQQFIASQRAQLSREKAKLVEDQRSPRGIIPSGSSMTMRSERLRQERNSEYQDFLKKRESGPKSVSEIRRQMAQERDQEISSHPAPKGDMDRQAQGQSSGVSSYNSLKNQKLREERQYRGAALESDKEASIQDGPRRRWNDEAPPHHRVRFDEREQNEITSRVHSRGWDEDERELMSWARGHGRGQESKSSRQTVRARTPPEMESPRTKVNQDANKSAKMRSISAPVVHGGGGGGIPGLSGRAEDSVEVRRNKQKEYAEILRAQIREREEAKERERVKEELMEVKDVEEAKSSKKIERIRDERNRRSTRDVKEEYHEKQRSPPHISEHEHYAPYRPPPSHFKSYPHYGPPDGPPFDWGSHYYSYYPPQPPPRNAHNFDYYPPDPYYNSYYHPSYRFPPPSHPRGENPYFPPRHEMRHSLPHGRQLDDDDYFRDEYSTRTRKQEYYKDDFEPRRKRNHHSGRGRGGSDEESSPLHGGGSRQRGTPMDKAAYRAELNRQMREKEESKLKAKLKRDMEDSKKETEVYDPFGKGGCGAPVRDQHGNLVADLKQMRKLNQERLNLSTSPSHQVASDGEQSTDSPRTVFTYDKVEDQTQNQSAHMTYRDFLKQQVEEKERKKEKEKRQQMMEEQRELDRLEKERKKLEEDFKHEREREKQREEEAKRKNEEMKREAEEKKRKAEEEKRREAERERQLADARLNALAERMAQPLPERRTYSPPIPTLRNKNHDEQAVNPPPPSVPQEQPTFRSLSPPVPAVLKKLAEEKQTVTQGESEAQLSLSQAAPKAGASLTVPPSSSYSKLPQHLPVNNSLRRQELSQPPTSSIQPAPSTMMTADQPSDILKQLAAMRMHLQSELAKKDGLQGNTHVGIFEKGRQPKPRAPGPRVARPKDNSVLTALNQFTHLKYANSARKDFVSKYPEPPDTESVLELQQDALIRHQEQQLAHLKGPGRGRAESNPAAGGYRQNLTGDPLNSDSINLPLGSRNDLFVNSNISLTSQGHMTTSMATGHAGPTRAQPQARPGGRRHPWGEGGGMRVPSAGGQSQFSVTTLDVDSMAVRNDERARRLEAILNAGSNDERQQQPRGTQHHLHQQQNPQAILHDFLRRTDGGASRQSEHSLDCETDFQRISSPHS